MHARGYRTNRRTYGSGRKIVVDDGEAFRLKQDQERKAAAEIRKGVLRRHYLVTTTYSDEAIEAALKRTEERARLRGKGMWWA